MVHTFRSHNGFMSKYWFLHNRQEEGERERERKRGAKRNVYIIIESSNEIFSGFACYPKLNNVQLQLDSLIYSFLSILMTLRSFLSLFYASNPLGKSTTAGVLWDRSVILLHFISHLKYIQYTTCILHRSYVKYIFTRMQIIKWKSVTFRCTHSKCSGCFLFAILIAQIIIHFP